MNLPPHNKSRSPNRVYIYIFTCHYIYIYIVKQIGFNGTE